MVNGYYDSFQTLQWCHRIFANWVIFHALLPSADFFQNQLFRRNLTGIPLDCQTFWILIWLEVLSGPDLGQNCNCKGFQLSYERKHFPVLRFFLMKQSYDCATETLYNF